MAKQLYEDKRSIKVVGRLDRADDNSYIVVVEDKDEMTTYGLDEILRTMEGNIISLSTDISLE